MRSALPYLAVAAILGAGWFRGVEPVRAAVAWPAYAASWLRWNHVRTALGAAEIVLRAAGLYAWQPGRP